MLTCAVHPARPGEAAHIALLLAGEHPLRHGKPACRLTVTFLIAPNTSRLLR